MNHAQRVSGCLPDGSFAKIIFVDNAATNNATEIMYGAIAIPLAATASSSVFDNANGFDKVFAFVSSVEANANCSFASINPVLNVVTPPYKVSKPDERVFPPSASFSAPSAIFCDPSVNLEEPERSCSDF